MVAQQVQEDRGPQSNALEEDDIKQFLSDRFLSEDPGEYAGFRDVARAVYEQSTVAQDIGYALAEDQLSDSVSHPEQHVTEDMAQGGWMKYCRSFMEPYRDSAQDDVSSVESGKSECQYEVKKTLEDDVEEPVITFHWLGDDAYDGVYNTEITDDTAREDGIDTVNDLLQQEGYGDQ